MHLYWTSLPTLDERTLSSGFDSHAGSFSTRNCQEVSSMIFFVIIPRAEPQVQH